MSPRDVPLWARGVAAVLLALMAWWLLRTDALRAVVGGSIGLVSLGIGSVFLLRGMQLPVALWPEGPWREKFSPSAVLGVAVLFLVCMVVARAVAGGPLSPAPDPGRALAAVVGVLTWGSAAGLVRQRVFLPWYALAVALGMLPHLVGVAAAGPDEASRLCLVSVAAPLGDLAESLGCEAAAVPTFLYLLVVGAAAALVTEELAFRRLLVGSRGEAGLVLLAVAGAVAVGWHAVAAFALGARAPVVLLATAAVSAGALYVLSRSLLVSATYTAAFGAALGAVTLSRRPGGEEVVAASTDPAVRAVTVLIGVVLLLLVLRRNGWLGGLRAKGTTDAPGD